MGKLRKVLIAGGAGFIGSHLCDHLLEDTKVELVTLYDNFSSGRKWQLNEKDYAGRLRLVNGEIADADLLEKTLTGHDTVFHLASNPDIAKAATEPSIDFTQGTMLTNAILEAMRKTKTKKILYASGSGVYGDVGHLEVSEDHGPLIPISTYGASKLAGETLIAAYCHMFEMEGIVFRFANVVGPRQTHGVAYDFIRKLRAKRTQLEILGDGQQTKSYAYVGDIISAVLLANEKTQEPFAAYNIGTGDCITVKEIADIVVQKLLGETSVKYIFSGGDRGWKGDVPVVRLNSDKIKKLGWYCQYSSRQAIEKSTEEMIKFEQSLQPGIVT